MVAEEVHIDLATVFVRILHSTAMGRFFLWEQDCEIEFREVPYDVVLTSDYHGSPTAYVVNTCESLRCQIEDHEGPFDFGMLEDFLRDGYFDYLIGPFTFTSDEHLAVSWTTGRESGFSEDDLTALREVTEPLARMTEILA